MLGSAAAKCVLLLILALYSVAPAAAALGEPAAPAAIAARSSPAATSSRQQQHSLLLHLHSSTQQQQQHKPPQPMHHQPRLQALPGGGVAPVLANYSFAAAQDTFELCRQQAGLGDGEEVPLEELLAAFRLPRDLAKHKHIGLTQLIELLHGVQPDFRVVYEPMLSGEADVGRLLEPPAAAAAAVAAAAAATTQFDGVAGAPAAQPAPAPAGRPLPRMVHFTVKDKNQLAPHQVLSMASWAAHNRGGYSLLLWDDADVRAFMTTYYPGLLATFDGLGSQVERTDLWRYLVLCRLGGVYADSDVVAARPVREWATDAGLLVGVENVFTTPEEARERSYSRQVQMVQWSIASQPGHPVVCSMGEYVARHVADEAAGAFVDPDRDHAILERTGPGIWSDSVHDHLRKFGNASIEALVAGGRVGDVRVLPQTVLGCPTAAYHAADQLPYVYHMFKGSWRLTQPSSFTVFLQRLKSRLHHRQQQQQQHGAAAAQQQQQPATTPGQAAGVLPAAVAVAAAGGEQQQQAAAVRAAAAKAAAAGAAAAALAGVPAGAGRRPRLPILDEQILAHEAKQRAYAAQHPELQLRLQAAAQQQAAAAAAAHAQQALHHHRIQLPLIERVQQQRQRRQHVQQPLRLPVAADLQQQQQQLRAPGAAGTLSSSSSSSRAASATQQQLLQQSRKLRSSQLLLVKPSMSPAYAAAGVLAEPELPSSALSGMQLLSLLVILALVGVVYRQHRQGSSSSSSMGWLCSPADGLPSKPGPGGRLSRPGSRGTLAGASSGALSALPGAMLLLPSVGSGPGGDAGLVKGSSGGSGRQDRLSGSPLAGGEQQDVCYASSSQPAGGRSHRHKRSWGSSSSFQQL